MICLSTGKQVTACVALVILVPVLSGCGAGGGTTLDTLPAASGALPAPGVSSPLSDSGLAVVTTVLDGSTTHGDEPGSHGAHAVATGTPATAAPTTLTSHRRSTGQTGTGPGSTASDVSTAPAESSASTAAVPSGTMAGSRRLAEWPRNNRQAANLLDHWGHRRSHRIKEGLSLADSDAEDNASNLRALRTAARAPDLHDNDEVQILGADRGVTYGRWVGGAGRHVIHRV